jgi:hypothetical protein
LILRDHLGEDMAGVDLSLAPLLLLGGTRGLSKKGARRTSAGTACGTVYGARNVEPLVYLTDVLQQIVSGRTKSHELRTLLPWAWHPDSAATATG